MALQAWIGDPLLAVAVRAATSSDVNCSTRGRNIRDGPLNVARVADVSGADLCVTSPSKRVITADEAARLDDSAPTTITAVTLPNEPMSSRYKGEYSPLIRFCLAIPRIFARAGKTNAGRRWITVGQTSRYSTRWPRSRGVAKTPISRRRWSWR